MKNKGLDQLFYGTPFGDKFTIPDMSVGKRIRKLRIENGLGLKELSELSGVPVSTISDLEHGRSGNPRGDTLVQLAAALKVADDWLQTGKGLPVRKTEGRIDEDDLLRVFRLLAAQNKEVLLTTAKALLGSQTGSHPIQDTENRPKRPDLQ